MDWCRCIWQPRKTGLKPQEFSFNMAAWLMHRRRSVFIFFIFIFLKFFYWKINGTEAEIQLPLKSSFRFQRLFLNPSWLVWGRASRHQKLAPTFPGIDSCLMVTKWDFLEMEASLWLNGRSQNVAKGWLST